jgi:hypothetical protein
MQSVKKKKQIGIYNAREGMGRFEKLVASGAAFDLFRPVKQVAVSPYVRRV